MRCTALKQLCSCNRTTLLTLFFLSFVLKISYFFTIFCKITLHFSCFLQLAVSVIRHFYLSHTHSRLGCLPLKEGCLFLVQFNFNLIFINIILFVVGLFRISQFTGLIILRYLSLTGFAFIKIMKYLTSFQLLFFPHIQLFFFFLLSSLNPGSIFFQIVTT